MKLPTEKKVKLVLPKDGPTIIHAYEAALGQYYWTAQSDWQLKPESKVLCSPVIVDQQGQIILRHWNSALQEWMDTAVPREYKLIPIKEGTVKIPKGSPKTAEKSKAPKAPKVSKRLKNQLGVTTKKGPEETWGVAFKNHKTAKQIVDFMKKEFPTIDKKWDSWVNHFRLQYNKGKLGQPAPKEALEAF